MPLYQHHIENCRETCSTLLDHLLAKHKQVITVKTFSFITEQNPCLKVNGNRAVKVWRTNRFYFFH